ncbi:MAG: hypothetical protein RIQ46_179 [Pseudomonadota bacterium]
MDWINDLAPHWHWLAIGLLLAAAEMAVPGVFLIWLAGAAIVTGLVAWAVPMGLPTQIVLFAVLAIVSVFTGKRYLRANPIEPADPAMNDRGARILGETVVVTHAIDGGQAACAMAIPNGWCAAPMPNRAGKCASAAMMAPCWLWSTCIDAFSVIVDANGKQRSSAARAGSRSCDPD